VYTSGGNVSKALSMGGKFTMPEGTTRHLYDVGTACGRQRIRLVLTTRLLRKWSSRHRGPSRPSDPRSRSGLLIYLLLLGAVSRSVQSGRVVRCCKLTSRITLHSIECRA